MRETEAGTEADLKDEDVNVVGGVDEVGVPGYKSEGFTLSEILQKKKRSEIKLSEGVVYTYHVPQYDFSNVQALQSTLLLEIVCWLVIDFFRLVVVRALIYDDYFVRLLCFSV